MKLLPKRDRLEQEFLPEALEIIETPTPPLGRIVLWGIVLFLAVALAWSYFGKVDIVATARGKITPAGDIKTIKPPLGGTVKSIKASEGQVVKKGEVLIELDTTASQADQQAMQRALDSAKLERDITRQLADGAPIDTVLAGSSVSDDSKQDLRRLAEAKSASLAAKQQSATTSINYYQSVVAARQTSLTQAHDTATKAREQEAKIQAEYDQSKGIDRVLAESRLNTARSNTAAAAGKVETIQAQVGEAENSLAQARNSLDQATSDARAGDIAAVIELDKKITELEQSLIKAQQNVSEQTITAPVDGTILTLAANTPGSAISAGQPLVVIVPANTPLIVTAELPNKDIGFVEKGQPVNVKIDTYSFQKYGYLPATISYVSSDALTKQDQPESTYAIKAKLSSRTTTNQGKTVSISPGMSVTADIKTGQRRIIEFLLEPIVKYTSESLQVR